MYLQFGANKILFSEREMNGVNVLSEEWADDPTISSLG